MKKKLILAIAIFVSSLSFSKEIPYPIIHIPGMFDNGELITADSKFVFNMNGKDGFYYKNYYNEQYNYDKEPFVCSSNIVGAKYNRLVVANLIGPYRTNLSLWLMADRFFCIMKGYAPKHKNYNALMNYKGIDYKGSCIRDGKTIYFKGLIEETWAKYGKKVHLNKIDNKFHVVLNENSTGDYYENTDGYFDTPSEIKFNLLVHSSGGIVLRRYLQMCREEKIETNVNLIVNLSIPQKGARLLYNIKSAFPILINDTVKSFYNNLDNGIVKVKDGKGNRRIYTYKEINQKTRIDMLNGDSDLAKLLRNIVGNYINYFIAIDGKKDVLATDPSLHDLHPDHKLIKTISKEPIPADIRIYNFKVTSAYSKMFTNLGSYLKLEQSDGAVDFRDNDLSEIPDYDELKVKDFIVEKANHIPFPYIKPVFEMNKTIGQYYGIMRILLKENMPKEKGVFILQAMMAAIMQEFGINVDTVMNEDNYSIIDYFVDHPIVFD
jgi:hypothetical protein